jgi:hypothetical protein
VQEPSSTFHHVTPRRKFGFALGTTRSNSYCSTAAKNALPRRRKRIEVAEAIPVAQHALAAGGGLIGRARWFGQTANIGA